MYTHFRLKSETFSAEKETWPPFQASWWGEGGEERVSPGQNKFAMRLRKIHQEVLASQDHPCPRPSWLKTSFSRGFDEFETLSNLANGRPGCEISALRRVHFMARGHREGGNGWLVVDAESSHSAALLMVCDDVSETR